MTYVHAEVEKNIKSVVVGNKKGSARWLVLFLLPNKIVKSYLCVIRSIIK